MYDATQSRFNRLERAARTTGRRLTPGLADRKRVRTLPVCRSMASLFKGLGYLVSAISVILLRIVAWKSASEQPLLFACLILGMIASVAGMTLRWISHRIDQKEKERIEREAAEPS